MKCTFRDGSWTKKLLPLLIAGAIAAAPTSSAWAEEAPTTTTQSSAEVKISGDWHGAELLQHLGTSYGVGSVGGRAASITTIHLERICRLPCAATLDSEGSYIVDGPGMNPRRFELEPGTKRAALGVHGAPQWPLTLSAYGVLLGGVAALSGGILWGIIGANEPGSDVSAFQLTTIVGASVLAAGIVGLIFLPRTHVEAAEGGSRLDASRTPAPKLRFTGNGFVF
jgi:hypothetical protein